MKNIVATAALFTLFCFTGLKAQTVYIAETGKKFHTKNCSALKSGKRSISLKEAVKQGYEACPGCNAGQVEADAKKKKSAEAKK